MAELPQHIAERLSHVSRQVRIASLNREVAAHAFRSSEMSRSSQQESLSRAKTTQHFAVRRLLAAIDQCDLAAAEQHLHAALSAAAWGKGIAQSSAAQDAA